MLTMFCSVYCNSGLAQQFLKGFLSGLYQMPLLLGSYLSQYNHYNMLDTCIFFKDSLDYP